MKETPILFSGPMVRATLEGRKTMTRRVVKPQLASRTVSWGCRAGQGFGFMFGEHDEVVKCPYGELGNRLWVRETFRCHEWATDKATIFYKASENASYTEKCEQVPVEGGKYLKPSQTWKPSIHMPRWASRIDLEITNVRVERLQNIEHDDALAEGITMADHRGDISAATEGSIRARFIYLWDQLNAKRGFGWDVNPWVWAIEFRKLEPADTIDPTSQR